MLTKREKKELETFIGYFPRYSNETLARFVCANDYRIQLWQAEIVRIEHENRIIRQEIERRLQAASNKPV